MSACLFCRIVAGEIPAEVVLEDPEVLVFRDIHPQAPVHLLIIPKKHVARLSELSPDDDGRVLAAHRAARVLAEKFGLTESGFRLVVNNGRDAGQAVDHLHYHLLGGRPLGWPPG
jgi:histidine triad (HIT) family protein